jgi:hypothetical protein
MMFDVGTLVNLPEIQRKQFHDMMANAKEQTLNSERTGLEILTPNMIRDFHNELQQLKNKSILTTPIWHQHRLLLFYF